jgi:hypothetical protein
MISRVWRGWTTPANADRYQQLLLTTIFPGIQKRGVSGYRGIDLHRRTNGPTVEFMTVMFFDSMAAVRAFAGEEYETAVVPPTARELLADFDSSSQHFEVIHGTRGP